MTTTGYNTTGLGDVSKALQALHQHLLSVQARDVGFNGSPHELFDLATKDQAFAWLKPLRSSIVALDERRADAEPIAVEEADSLHNGVVNLLDVEDGPLSGKLTAAFQSSPDAIWALHSARQALAALA